MKSHTILCWTACVLFVGQGICANEPLFHDGRTDWKIYLSPQADPTETFAAEELHDALKKISGAECGGAVLDLGAGAPGDHRLLPPSFMAVITTRLSKDC